MPSREDFLKRYPLLFTAEVKAAIADAIPHKEPDGYSFSWNGHGKRSANSYSLTFHEDKGGGVTLDGLYEGPRE